MYTKAILLVLCALIGKSVEYDSYLIRWDIFGTVKSLGFTRCRDSSLRTRNLRCYACSFSSVDPDRSCLTVTESTLSVDCPYQYCTITRQEFVDPAGEIASFLRGCDAEPDFLNHDVTDFHYRTYYRACTSDLCNIGDGIQSVVGGNLSPTPEYVGDNLLVPGTGGATIAQISIILFLTLLAINIYNY